jgi:predicted alpha/beta hydrolase
MVEEAIRIPARDGLPLAALLYRPANEPHAALIINSATSIPKEFYRRFASYAAEQGYATLIYDYRGIGGSRPASLRGFAATMRDWGEQDMPAALDWLHQCYAGLPLFAIGHSVGGQFLGLLPNHQLLARAVMVGVSSGYWGGMDPGFGLYSLLVWYGIMPLTTALLGYLPAKRFRFGEDLPLGVARDWRRWCLNPRYYGDELGTTIKQHYYDAFRTPLLWLSFSDDLISTARNVPVLQKLYGATSIDDRRIAPASVGLRAIGHTGFFRQGSRERLWPLPFAWFEHV